MGGLRFQYLMFCEDVRGILNQNGSRNPQTVPAFLLVLSWVLPVCDDQ